MSTSNGSTKTPLAGLYYARQLVDRGLAPDDTAIAGKYPLLWQMLCDQWIDEDKRVDSATVTFYVQAGDWFFRLSSPSLRASLTVAVRAFDKGLPAIEKALGEGEKHWRFYTKKKPSVRKEKKPNLPLADSPENPQDLGSRGKKE